MMHHLCIFDYYLIFDGEVIPYGRLLIEEEVTRAIDDILEMIVYRISDNQVIVCGSGDARRMLGRKLEDRLKREVKYE